MTVMWRPAADPTSAEGIELPKSRLINHLSRLANDLDALPDVVFVLNNGEDKVFAHKSILVGRSPVFRFVLFPLACARRTPHTRTTAHAHAPPHTHTQERKRKTHTRLNSYVSSQSHVLVS